MTIFYFTATGNSLAVAKHIGGTLISIPQVVDSDNLHYKDDAIGIVFPIYWWNLPVMVRRFLDKANFEADYTFAIGTYGNVTGAVMTRFKGFDYTNCLRMVDNYIPVFDMGAETEKLPKKRVDEYTAKIVADINDRKHMNVKANFITKAMTAIFGRIFKPDKNARKYIVNDKCNNCGVCTQVCLAKNIAVTDKVSFNDCCEGCLACLHHCPQNALHVKSEKSDKRWRNPEISLKEIIDANNRAAN